MTALHHRKLSTHFLVLTFCVCLAPFTPAADAPSWLTRVPPLRPGKFPPPQPAVLTYAAGWSGMTAGKINASFSNKSGQETLRVNGGTIGLARLLYLLDTDSVSHCDAKSLLPTHAEIKETYADEARHTTLQFTPKKVVLLRTSTPPQKSDGKERITKLPHVLDLQSSLLYLRSQPLEPGDQITFLTYATGSPYLANVRVLAREQLTVPCGKFPSLKLQLNLQGIDKKLALKPYTRAKNIVAWVSDDANRLFLKFTADLVIGTVFVEAEKISVP